MSLNSAEFGDSSSCFQDQKDLLMIPPEPCLCHPLQRL